MDEAPTATIIPFPKRRAPEPLEQATPAQQDRLAVALAGLSVALEEQKASLQAWRTALQELSTSVQSLGDNMNRVDQSLAPTVAALGS
jgi:hypothetical protein